MRVALNIGANRKFAEIKTHNDATDPPMIFSHSESGTRCSSINGQNSIFQRQFSLK